MGIQEEEIVISGPEITFKIFEGSLAQYFIPRMKAQEPDAVVHINADTGESIKAGEFLKLSLQIAEGFKELGLKEEDVVPLLGKNSIRILAVALGVLWNGGVFAPLDPSLKFFELRNMFKMYEPKFVVCEESCLTDVKKSLEALGNNAQIIILSDKADSSSVSLPYIRDILKDVDVENYVPLPVKDPANQLAAIMSSSGTTGLPKGVGITHRNFLFQLGILEEGMSLNQMLKMPSLQPSHFFWISAVYSLFLSCVIQTQRVFITKMEPANILKAIQNYKLVWGLIPPSELIRLSKDPDFEQYDLSSFKLIGTGGSPLLKSVVDLVKKMWGEDKMLMQGYGLTELTGGAANYVPGAEVFTVGKVLKGTQMKVVDLSSGKSLGPNQTGELHFKSPGLMKGYVGNEEATRDAIDKDGWLHTGDLGYYTEEGFIYIVDRIKEFIKCRNQQISPAEIESFIVQLPGVLEAGVTAVPHEIDQYQAIALVVKTKGSTVTEEEIINHVKENLSEFKQLRAGVKFVDSLPLTGSGKIKRSALKELAAKLHSSL